MHISLILLVFRAYLLQQKVDLYTDALIRISFVDKAENGDFFMIKISEKSGC